MVITLSSWERCGGSGGAPGGGGSGSDGRRGIRQVGIGIGLMRFGLVSQAGADSFFDGLDGVAKSKRFITKGVEFSVEVGLVQGV